MLGTIGYFLAADDEPIGVHPSSAPSRRAARSAGIAPAAIAVGHGTPVTEDADRPPSPPRSAPPAAASRAPTATPGECRVGRGARVICQRVTDVTGQTELWGAETRKAVENFPVSGEPIPAPVVHWLGRIKAAAARVNADLGLLDAAVADRIAAAADEVAEGRHDDQFPIDVFQTGSGTSSNMNANEVIANLAGEGVHPNDHVNLGQSSNDVFPSAVHLAALDAATNRLLPALDTLAAALAAKADEFADIVKTGRTHLMDAVPVTLGQEFGGYAAQVREGHARVESRSAAPRPDPARRHRDGHRPQHPPGVRRAGARAPRGRHRASRSRRRPTRSRRRLLATAWSRRPARSRPSPSR